MCNRERERERERKRERKRESSLRGEKCANSARFLKKIQTQNSKMVAKDKTERVSSRAAVEERERHKRTSRDDT